MTEQRRSHYRPDRAEDMPGPRWRAAAIGIGLLVLGGVGIIALHGPDRQGSQYVVAEPEPAAQEKTDSQAAELARCRAETDPDMTECQKLWEARRRRFFGQATEPGPSRALHPTPPAAGEHSAQLNRQGK